LVTLRVLIYANEILKFVQLSLLVVITYITNNNLGVLLGTVVIMQIVLSLITRDAIVDLKAQYESQLKGEKKL
jgi:hypothetical protein